METSLVQSAKIAIVGATGLSKDALHIYAGLAVYLVSALALRQRAHAFLPVLLVALVACIGEALDMRDDIGNLGYWRWGASLHDIVNTSFWPCILYFFARHTDRAGSSDV